MYDLLYVCSSPTTSTSVKSLGTAHDTLYFNHRSIPMQQQYNTMQPKSNNKLQHPYYMTENDTMNMTPLGDSLLLGRDNTYNYSQHHVLPYALATQRTWSERILQEIIGLLYILSPSGKILYCSESCIDLIGYHPQELIGKSLTEFLHTDDIELLSRNLRMSFNTMTRIKIHYRFRKKDNTYLLFESIGQPKQDTLHQPPQLFFAIAQPYLSRDNDLSDPFLEVKMENEWLKKQLHDMMLTQGGSPVSNSADTSGYQQEQQLNLHQLQQNGTAYTTNSSSCNLDRNYEQHQLSDQNLNTHNMNYQHNDRNEFDVQYFPPQTYPTTTATATTAVFDNPDLLLGPSAHYYMNNNDSPKLWSRRPSSCNSTMFQTNNNNHNSTSTTADENTNNYWNMGHNYSPSVASSVEVNEMMVRYQQEEHANTTSEAVSATAIHNSTGGLATTSSYLSSNNSTTTINTDIANKEKWRKKKKSRGTDDYVCADCGTTASPEWRKGPQGPKTLCNACGLRWAKKNKKI